MVDKDPTLSGISEEQARLLRVLDTIYPRGLSVSYGHLNQSSQDGFYLEVKELLPVLSSIWEWAKDHPVQLHYIADAGYYPESVDFDSIEKLNDVSKVEITEYDNGERKLAYFQVRDGLEKEDRYWHILHAGKFFNVDHNLLYKSPVLWNFVTDDPEGLLEKVSKETGNPMLNAEGNAPWCFKNFVLVDDELNDFYFALTASSEKAFDSMPEAIYLK